MGIALYSCFLQSLDIVLCQWILGYFLHDKMKIVLRLNSIMFSYLNIILKPYCLPLFLLV